MKSLNGSILPMSTLLPEHIRDQLVAASKMESRIDFGECPARAAVLDAVIANAKEEVPDLFI